MDCSRYLLVTDVDGTLLDHTGTVPARNREAIAAFMQAGGGFCIASGRSRLSVQCLLERIHLSVNRPCVLINGAMLYDYNTARVASLTPLPPVAEQFMQQVLREFPYVGAEVFVPDGIVMIRDNALLTHHRRYEEPPGSFIDVALSSVPWGKVLFAVPPEKMSTLQAYCETHAQPGLHFVASSDHYFEMMATKANKGEGVRTLARQFGYELSHVAAIGDYYNDVEMLSAAGIPAVPNNAPKAMKQMFPHVVCRCDEGAVGDLLEELMATC